MSPPTKLRLLRLEVGRRRHRAREDEVAEARGEALDLRLDRVGHVAAPAVRDVAVRPGGVLALRRAGRVEQRVLGEQHERPLGRRCSSRRRARRRRSRRASRRGGRSPARRALGRAPRDRPVERPVELECARAVPVAARARGRSAPGSRGDPQELARGDVGEHDLGRAAARPPGSTRISHAVELRCRAHRRSPARRRAGSRQPATWPSTPSASPKPALGRRSSGSIECAASPAKSARARSVANRDSRERAGVVQRGERRPGEPQAAGSARSGGGSGPRTSCSASRHPSTIGRDQRAVGGGVGAEVDVGEIALEHNRGAVVERMGDEGRRVDPRRRPAPPSGRRARRVPSGGSPSRGRGGSPAASARRCGRLRRSRRPPRRPRRRALPASA